MDIEKLTPDSKLRTNELAEALTQKVCQTSPATLATMRSRGGGPPYQRWGRIPVYTWGEALKWAQTRLGEPRCSTSEEDAIAASAAVPPPAAPAEPSAQPQRANQPANTADTAA